MLKSGRRSGKSGGVFLKFGWPGIALWVVYPQIVQSLNAQLLGADRPENSEFMASSQLVNITSGNPDNRTKKTYTIDPDLLLNRLTFSHFVEL